MKELKFVQACPDDTYYTWQVHMWLESLRNIGQSDKAVSLIFTPKGRQFNNKWQKIVELYPEAEFNFYNDEDNLTSLIPIYIPVLRPYVLWRYFKSNPALTTSAIFYCDSDILFTEKFDIDHLLEDDVCYLSDTKSYIASTYFDSKVNDVLPDKKEEYKQRDILAEVMSVIGLTRDVADERVDSSGGAQYLLKGVDSQFWSKVMNDCIIIRTYLQKINREFFESESKGFQSWCADMWAVLWNLWLREKETKIVPEMDFAWASDSISKLDKCSIMHNAGIVGKQQDGYLCFYKGSYHTGQDPTKDAHLQAVLEHEKSKTRCTWFYANELMKLKEKYNLNY